MSDWPLFVVGPTAVGKSEVALLLAERLGGEIVSVDSMQVYTGMDIGTAKPSVADRRRVRHHLIDIRSLNQSFDAAQFVNLAEAACAEIQERGCRPIFSGGTGLWFKAFLSGLGNRPAADPALRMELDKVSLTELIRELQVSDPAAAAGLDLKNRRRVVRAIEVNRLTDQSAATTKADWRSSTRDATVIGLRRGPDDRRARIDRRVDQMFQEGLVAETERLIECGLRENRTAMQALGYRQVVEHLEGIRSLSETVALVKSRTRQYAKRQMTWFRRQMEPAWIDLAPEEATESIVNRIIDGGFVD